MHLAPSARHVQLRAELHDYFATLMPSGPPDATDRDAVRALLRQIGADGLLGLGWPTEYGGQGRGPDEQFIFFDEAQRAGAPVSMVTLNTVGPTLIKYGSPHQKAHFLPRILSGEIVFAIGYSEPEAGTDLAALRTRAVREGDHWVVDGQKIFTSNAQHADWIWLACRTDPEAPKHQGISIILVPTDSPGFSWTPIETVGGLTTTATYYDALRVPADHLVGPEHGGWGLITNQLNHERVALAALGMQAEDAFQDALEHTRACDPVTGRRPADHPWVRSRLAEASARLAALRLLNWRLVQDVGSNTLAPGDASGVKFFGTESTVEVYRICQEVVGERALLRGPVGTCGRQAAGCYDDGSLERMNRAAQINTFGGGVSEIQREILAGTRLGMKGRRR
ncbi:acyl-CoA dehydrogenase family protein [Streptomyces sp. NPDC006879]|uniref:acyl-CoA dehydrogenase family protein n=1 Tax=Streptomyces sp. NPDC006879 TaxID=3364767 RepID=UPI003689A8C5